jgi:antitoxin component of RelBE/YafQ-DinJ toxin-antitoxin module
MEQQTTTESVRIDKDTLDKIRSIAKAKGQTISGYINLNLNKQVDRDWAKFENKKDAKIS